MALKPSLSTFLPELFTNVAGHLPLYATPPTLLSMALVNQDFYDIFNPLLYSRLILRNENDALKILQRLLSDSQLGHAVRELHIMSELSLATRNGERPFDVITGLKKVIAAGLLPHIHTLSLHLDANWRIDNVCRYVKGYGQLDAGFWKELRSKCPRLGAIIVSGLGDNKEDPWLNDSGIYDLNDLKGLSHLGLTFLFRAHAQNDGTERLLMNICHVSSSLHTLVLKPYFKYESASAIMSLDFPRLRSLVLGMLRVEDTSEAMAFWRRHPSLERLKITNCTDDDLWFDQTIDSEILPNLRHLEANFGTVLILVPILHRLVGLSIQQSLNAQIPYLLRSIIPKGLHNLKSLEMDQDWCVDREIRDAEGSMWYETLDGEFHQEKKLKHAGRSFMDDYIHSIARGAPNLEELALHGETLHPFALRNIIPALAGFLGLKRLYFRGINNLHSDQLQIEERRAAFLTVAGEMAEHCKLLQTITDISPPTLPYLTAKIHRSESGTEDDVVFKEGYGMQIGYEDEPFPCNPDSSARQ